MSLYTIPLKDSQGRPTTLEKYKHKVLLIVNIASNCGLAKKNYDRLSDLLHLYYNKGLRILLFPCHDFFQEPNSMKKIKETISEYSDQFELFDKISVIGSDKHELYGYLTDNFDNKWYGKFIKWNFTKFLVDRNGKVVMRYGPSECLGEKDKYLMKALEQDDKNGSLKEDDNNGTLKENDKNGALEQNDKNGSLEQNDKKEL